MTPVNDNYNPNGMTTVNYGFVPYYPTWPTTMADRWKCPDCSCWVAKTVQVHDCKDKPSKPNMFPLRKH